MSTTETDRLVDDYLRQLDTAAAHLQRSRRAELVAEIREHIEAALGHEQAADETVVRNVLERLGPPEEIVEAAEPPAVEGGRGRAGALEIVALVALVVPVVGWLVGIVLVLVSNAWSRRAKTVGVVLALLPALIPLVLLMAAGSESGGGSVSVPGDPSLGEPETTGDGGLGTLEIAALILGFGAGLPSAIYLGWQLRRPVSDR